MPLTVGQDQGDAAAAVHLAADLVDDELVARPVRGQIGDDLGVFLGGVAAGVEVRVADAYLRAQDGPAAHEVLGVDAGVHPAQVPEDELGQPVAAVGRGREAKE